MNCVFSQHEGRLKCLACGRLYPPDHKTAAGWQFPIAPQELAHPDKVNAKCIVAAPDLTIAAEKLGISLADAKNWSKAVARWFWQGCPMRTADEVAACAEVCGAPCDQLAGPVDRGGRCRLCGCQILSRIAVKSKAKMATEDCPLHLWPPRRADE